jgi:hypothetical protein
MWISPSQIVRARDTRPVWRALIEALNGEEVPGLDLEEVEDSAILELVARGVPGRVVWTGTTLEMQFLDDPEDAVIFHRAWMYLPYLDWLILQRPMPTADHTSS